MKVIKRYNQYRRDLTIDVECEGCGSKSTIEDAYDDDNYWRNVVPNFKCKSCEKSTNDLGIKDFDTHTRYLANEVI